jgi:hypothetical protein
MTRHRKLAAVAGMGLLALSTIAEAQWVLLARRAVGRIEQMSQTGPNGEGSYDVATVIVEVPPGQVYDVVKKRLLANPQLKVTSADDERRSIAFNDGRQFGGIQVATLGDGLSQLLISTAHPGIPAATTSMIVERIIAVCGDLQVRCERGSP